MSDTTDIVDRLRADYERTKQLGLGPRFDTAEVGALFAEITRLRAALAQAGAVREPVATVGDLIIQVRERVVSAGIRNNAPLYAHPSPAQREPLSERPSRADLIAALQFYAGRGHFILSDESAWDTVSGEPQNWWCDEAGTATIEDGSLAKMALDGEMTAEHFAALERGDDVCITNSGTKGAAS